jgi:hypothetical protein
MTTPNEKIRRTLDELGRQLADAENLEPQVAERLSAMIADVRAKIDESPVEEDEHRTLAERFREATIHFEESHPTLAGTVERLVDTLAQMGI